MSANLQKRSASQQPVRKSARISLQQNNAIFGVNQERKEEKQVRKEAAGEEVREASVVRNSSLVNGVLTSTTRICFPNSCSICFERFSTSGGDAKLLPIGDFCAGHFVLPEEVMEQQQGGGQKNISQLVSTNPFDDVLGQSDYPLAASFVAMFDQWSMLPPNSLILRGYSLPAYSDAVATQMLRQCCESCFLAALQARIESNLPLIKFPVNLRQFKIFCPLCPRDSNNAITHIDLLERSFTAAQLAPLWGRIDADIARRMTPVVHCPQHDCAHVELADCAKRTIDCATHGKTCVKCWQAIPLSKRHKCGGVGRAIGSREIAAQLRRCTTCDTIIQKNGGCDIVRCSMCSVEFNWSEAQRVVN
jgi:hypothetical protein